TFKGKTGVSTQASRSKAISVQMPSVPLGAIMKALTALSARRCDWGLISHVGIEKRCEHEYLTAAARPLNGNEYLTPRQTN
ncbi:hypothetical protein THAOC_16475, partial [Thalassiosira oceanica]